MSHATIDRAPAPGRHTEGAPPRTPRQPFNELELAAGIALPTVLLLCLAYTFLRALWR